MLSFTRNTSFSDRFMASFKDSPGENVLTLCRGCFAFPDYSQKKQAFLSYGDVWERVSCEGSLIFLFASFGPSICLSYLNVNVTVHQILQTIGKSIEKLRDHEALVYTVQLFGL